MHFGTLCTVAWFESNLHNVHPLSGLEAGTLMYLHSHLAGHQFVPGLIQGGLTKLTSLQRQGLLPVLGLEFCLQSHSM